MTSVTPRTQYIGRLILSPILWYFKHSFQEEMIYILSRIIQQIMAKNEVPSKYVVPPKYGKKSLLTTVVYRSSHYATLAANTVKKEIYIYDGLFGEGRHKMCMWKSHIELFVQLITGKKFMYLQFKITNATKLGPFQFFQHDLYNCGPIACLTMWYLASTDKERTSFTT